MFFRNIEEIVAESRVPLVTRPELVVPSVLTSAHAPFKAESRIAFWLMGLHLNTHGDGDGSLVA